MLKVYYIYLTNSFIEEKLTLKSFSGSQHIFQYIKGSHLTNIKAVLPKLIMADSHSTMKGIDSLLERYLGEQGGTLQR